MRALYLKNGLHLRSDYPVPEPPPGESLVRVRLAGICNTDVELARGYLAFQGVIGHEFVGVVEQSDHPALIGRRVVGEINAACHRCDPCRRGDVTHCANRTVLGIVARDGAHADFLILPTENLHPVPDSVPDEKAVFTEPLAAACEILEQIQIRPTDRIAVIGDGKLGLLCAQVLALTGAEVHAIGRHEGKLELLQRRGIGVEVVRRGEASQKPAGWADIVVEATGNSEGFVSARRLVRPRGTLVLKSTYHGTLDVNLSLVVVDEITLLGSRCGPFAPALRLLTGDLVDVTSLVHERFSLSEAERAMDRAVEPGVLKVLLEMD